MNKTQLGPGMWLHDPAPWWLSFYEEETRIGAFHVGKLQQIMQRMAAAGITLAEKDT